MCLCTYLIPFCDQGAKRLSMQNLSNWKKSKFCRVTSIRTSRLMAHIHLFRHTIANIGNPLGVASCNVMAAEGAGNRQPHRRRSRGRQKLPYQPAVVTISGTMTLCIDAGPLVACWTRTVTHMTRSLGKILHVARNMVSGEQK